MISILWYCLPEGLFYRRISNSELDFSPGTIFPTTKYNIPLESKYSEIQLDPAEFRGLKRKAISVMLSDSSDTIKLWLSLFSKLLPKYIHSVGSKIWHKAKALLVSFSWWCRWDVHSWCMYNSRADQMVKAACPCCLLSLYLWIV